MLLLCWKVRRVQSSDCDIFAIVILLPFQKSCDMIIAAVHYYNIAMILNYCQPYQIGNLTEGSIYKSSTDQ